MSLSEALTSRTSAAREAQSDQAERERTEHGNAVDQLVTKVADSILRKFESISKPTADSGSNEMKLIGWSYMGGQRRGEQYSLEAISRLDFRYFFSATSELMLEGVTFTGKEFREFMTRTFSEIERRIKDLGLQTYRIERELKNAPYYDCWASLHVEWSPSAQEVDLKAATF